MKSIGKSVSAHNTERTDSQRALDSSIECLQRSAASRLLLLLLLLIHCMEMNFTARRRQPRSVTDQIPFKLITPSTSTRFTRAITRDYALVQSNLAVVT